MGIIRLLDEQLINKIAAGEVIERPASIVKELLENSIDAGSSEISIEIKGGGISYIRISDNGSGMEREDIEKAFLRHATSKLKTDKDLYSITTLGFRGEALASIAAVSKVELMSKIDSANTGYRILIEGGKIITFEECGCPSGTVITVQNVFFNTPARLKFLKTESRESANITDVVQNIALSHTDIAFKYITNSKPLFVTRGDRDLKGVMHLIYGKEVSGNLLQINYSRDLLSLKGFIGNRNVSKASRNYQSVFVNSRLVKSKTITAAAENAYKTMMMSGKFPLFILNISVNPEFVDVNVHPAKAEVKFEDDQLVYKTVFGGIREALLKDYDPKDFDEPAKEESKPEHSYFQETMAVNSSEVSQSILREKEKVYNEGVKWLTKEDEKPETPALFKQEDSAIKISAEKAYTMPENLEKSEVKVSDYHNKYYVNNAVKNVNLIEENPISSKPEGIPKFGPLSVIGQLHLMYIIAESADEMFLIDQHAAHERIYFEKYLSEFNSRAVESQSLLVPIISELTYKEKEYILHNPEAFKKFGFEVEDYGGNSVAVRAVPVVYGNPDPLGIFRDMTEVLDTEKELIDYVDRVIYTMACKSAVKAGDKLSWREMHELVEKLRFCDNPFNCPHGRPTIIKFTYQDLEKKFKRIV